jgi:putative transposase
MKTLRTYIAKPADDVTWKDIGTHLRNLQYDTAKILNYAMTEWFLWQRTKEELKVQNGKYPTFKEHPVPDIYKPAREMFPDMHSRMVNAIVRKSKLKWDTDCKEVFYGQTKSLSSFRKRTPVIIDQQSYTVKTSDGYVFTAGLFSGNVKGQRRFGFILNTKKLQKSQKQILDRIISKEYVNGAAQIGYNDRKRKWFLNFAYEPPKKSFYIDLEVIVGVDLGVSKSFFCAVNNSKQRLCADGWEIESFRKRIRKRRISMLRQSPFSGRKGKGRKNLLEPTDRIGDKERRFRDTRYHQYSKMIVDFVVKNHASVLQMEDLKSLKESKKDNFVLKDWAIADLQGKIEYKANEYDIKVVYVNPQYTSQRCYKCGNISRSNRPDQKTFLCETCGYKENADYNAACNLSTKDIDKIIANHKLSQNTREVRTN